MKNEDLLFKYSYDLSNGYDIEEKERDNKFDSFLREAMKKRERFYKPTTLDPDKVENFISARLDLSCIATENMALMRVSMNPKNTRVCVEIESNKIDIDRESPKECFINVLKVAKFVTIKPNNNGKLVMTSEFDLARSQN